MSESEVTHNQDIPVESKSRPKGAYRTMWGNTWWSMIMHNKKRIYLGTFPSLEAASEAYNKAKASLKDPSNPA